MKIIEVEQNSPEWLELRKGCVTGSKLGDLIPKRGTKRKIGFYQILAERIAIDEDAVNPMTRGSDLEEEALSVFEQDYDKVVERVGFCVSDKNARIGVSPDGLIKDAHGKYTEAVEVKCLKSANQLQAHYEKSPGKYFDQGIQYFIVNEDLQTLFFVFYDPRITALPMVVLEMKREDVADTIEVYREYQEKALEEIEEMVQELTF